MLLKVKESRSMKSQQRQGNSTSEFSTSNFVDVAQELQPRIAQDCFDAWSTRRELDPDQPTRRAVNVLIGRCLYSFDNKVMPKAEARYVQLTASYAEWMVPGFRRGNGASVETLQVMKDEVVVEVVSKLDHNFCIAL